MPFPVARPVVFPLFGIVNGRCACGDENCSRVGKHPQVAWGDLAYGDAVPRPARGAGAGIKTGAESRGSGIFVVDVDGDDALERWRALGDTPETLTVRTGRGWQCYFSHPGFPVRNSAGELAKGIDIRGDGGFVVAPGSPHKSGATYQVVVDAPLAPAPIWLLDWLRARPALDDIQPYPGDVDTPYLRRLFTEYLKRAPPCIEGRGGDAQLFHVVQHGAYDLQLPAEVVLDLIRVHYDPRCEPPWGDALEERVRHKARSAKECSTRPRAEPWPEDLAHLLGGATDDDAARDDDADDEDSEPPLVTPFRFVWADELSQPVPPTKYVMRHFGIAPGRPSLLAGYGGIGKTIVAQVLGLAVAAGAGECWGLPIASGCVIHFDYEMTLEPLQRRYQRLAIGHSVDLRACKRRLGVASMPSLYLSDAAAEDALCAATERATLALVDNLAAAVATAGEKENEAGIRRYLDKLTRVTAKTGCVFFVLVHERKAGKDETAGIQRVRGSSAITDASGAVISVSSAEGDGVITLVQTKASLRRREEELTLQIEDVWPTGTLEGVGEDAPGLRVRRLEERPASEQSQRLQARILELLSKGPHETKHKINKALGMKNGTVGPEVDALIVRREIAFIKGTGFVLDNPVARRERVAAVVSASDAWRSVAEIAKAAHVDVDVVNELLRDGVLARSAEGRFLVVD